MKHEVAIDLIDIKQKIASGRFAAKINSFGSILLEDTMTCEAVKLMQLPEGYSFHEKGEWEPCWVYTSSSVHKPMDGMYGYSCSICGETATERTDWCTCGADMRESNRIKDMTKKHLEELLKQL